MNEPRQWPIHQVLVAPDLAAGGERYLVWPLWMMVALIAFVGIITAYVWVGVAVIVGFLSHGCLRFLAKIDPLWFRVYLRNRRYKRYYPAHSRARRK